MAERLTREHSNEGEGLMEESSVTITGYNGIEPPPITEQGCGSSLDVLKEPKKTGPYRLYLRSGETTIFMDMEHLSIYPEGPWARVYGKLLESGETLDLLLPHSIVVGFIPVSLVGGLKGVLGVAGATPITLCHLKETLHDPAEG